MTTLSNRPSALPLTSLTHCRGKDMRPALAQLCSGSPPQMASWQAPGEITWQDREPESASGPGLLPYSSPTRTNSGSLENHLNFCQGQQSHPPGPHPWQVPPYRRPCCHLMNPWGTHSAPVPTTAVGMRGESPGRGWLSAVGFLSGVMKGRVWQVYYPANVLRATEPYMLNGQTEGHQEYISQSSFTC